MAKAATQMSLLASLQITNEKKPNAQAAGKDPVVKFIESLDAQAVYVDKELKGEELPQTRGGKMPKRTYWKKGLEFFVTVAYGNAPLDLGGGSVVKAGKSLEDVKKVLNTLKEAAKAGELDEPIHAAAAAVSARLAGRGGRKAAK